MNTALEFASGLARQTGELLLQYYRRSGVVTHLKADRSVVTDADLAADRLIRQEIQAAYPADGLLSEELNPGVQACLPECVWVVDPLDGTTNFSLGLHVWGVLLARIVNGAPDTAALYFPLLDELYTAQRWGGAWLNGEPIQPRPPVKDQPAAFFACCGRTHRHYNVSVPYKPRILGSSAYTLCAVARGAAVLGFEATPKIWDLTAAWLLVQEAGGVVETYQGSAPFPLQTGVDYEHITFPTIAAANAGMVARGREMILPKS
jgi:myo-inositol-1(or 4)-monophosphatase